MNDFVSFACGVCATLLVQRLYAAAGAYRPALHVLKMLPHSSATPSGIVPDMLLRRSNFAVGYNFRQRGPDYACFILTSQGIRASSRYRIKPPNFRVDYDIPAEHRAPSGAYTECQGDRGHLAPRAAIGFDAQSLNESYLLSNVVVQHADINRGPWSAAERAVREHVLRRGSHSAVVIVGAVYDRGPSPLAPSPTHMYMCAMDCCTGESIGFFMPATRKRGKPTSLVRATYSMFELEAKLRQHELRLKLFPKWFITRRLAWLRECLGIDRKNRLAKWVGIDAGKQLVQKRRLKAPSSSS